MFLKLPVCIQSQMRYRYLSYYAQKNFVLFKKMCMAFRTSRCQNKFKYQCFVNNRIAIVPCVSLLFSTIARCSADNNKLKILDPKSFTHEYLIRQACSLNVDAATQLLTLTVAAILDINKSYRKSLQDLISLTQESLQTISMTAYQEDLWDQIIEARSQMEDLKKSLLELTSFMEYVEKVATSAAEASYLGGADYASTAMCERINSAHQQLHIEQQKTKTLEAELLETQETYVQKATSFKKSSAEEKVEAKKQNSGSLLKIIDTLSDDDIDT